MEKLIAGLKIFGVNGHVSVSTKNGFVYVDGKYFGVWDFARNTFID